MKLWRSSRTKASGSISPSQQGCLRKTLSSVANRNAPRYPAVRGYTLPIPIRNDPNPPGGDGQLGNSKPNVLPSRCQIGRPQDRPKTGKPCRSVRERKGVYGPNTSMSVSGCGTTKNAKPGNGICWFAVSAVPVNRPTYYGGEPKQDQPTPPPIRRHHQGHDG